MKQAAPNKHNKKTANTIKKINTNQKIQSRNNSGARSVLYS